MMPGSHCGAAIVYQTAETGSYSPITLSTVLVHPSRSSSDFEYFGFSLFKIVFEFLSKQKA